MPTSSVFLRPLTTEDAIITWQWRNQADVKAYYSDHPFLVTYKQELEWYSKNIIPTENLRVFGLEADGRLVGLTMLKHIHPIHKHTEFAIIIDEKEYGKGFGTKGCKLTLTYAFDALNLNRVYLKVRTDHPSAVKMYTSCGFEIEGTLRDDVFKNNKFYDQYIMGILRK